MSTLLLRLAAPMQSWGSDSKFERRTTQREPTKSGVIGMLAAALGRGRDEDLSDLSALKFGVRIDQPGQILKDFHTVWRPDSAKETYFDNRYKGPYVTNRYYLVDAVFVIGLSGDVGFLKELCDAVRAPVYPLFLGRRSCPPDANIVLGIRDTSLENALYEEPWQAGLWYQKREIRRNKNLRLTMVTDSADVGANRRRDLPISFNQKHRKHAYRYIDDKPLAVPASNICRAFIAESATEHDPFNEVL